LDKPSSRPSQAQPSAEPDQLVSFRSPSELSAKLDAWIAAQAEPRPDRAAAIQRLLESALAGVSTEPHHEGRYRATRIGPNGTVDEWQAGARDDEEAAHRLGRHLKAKIEAGAAGYTPDEMVNLIRPDGEIVTMARVKELIERLTGWKTAPSADPGLEGEWGG
jgi:hypothetical protein